MSEQSKDINIQSLLTEISRLKAENELMMYGLSRIAEDRPIDNPETLELMETARWTIMELAFIDR